MQPGQMAYDRAITVFSPDGRLFQVEYARVAVLRGTTTAGVKYKDGVVLMADKKMTSRLVVAKSIEKISQIDEHIGCATSGLVADARVLVDYARVASQINKITYSEKITVELLVKKICDYKQAYTQYGGVRPFGTALLVGGCDEKGVHLYETDPSGSLTAYNAGSIGDGRNTVMEIFEDKFKDNMDFEEAIGLGLEALQRASETPLRSSAVEVGIVEMDKKFYKLDEVELQKYISRVTPPSTEGSEDKDKKK
jgi:proteasome alpha subunit